MAGDNRIKISADTSSIKKSLMDLSKDVKDLGKSKVAIFDKSQKDFLSKEAKSHMEAIKKQIDANNRSILATTKLMNQEGRTLEQTIKSRQRLTNLMRKQVDLQKDLNKLGEFESGLSQGGVLGKMKGMLGKGASALGMGGMMRMLGPLGLAVGAGGFAISRARKAFGTFEGGIDDRIKLRGRGVSDLNLQDQDSAAAVGLNAQTMRRARLASMDVFGQAASTQQAVIQRSAFERNFGLERGTITNLGQGVSETLGGEQSNKAMMTLQASLIASGITDEIGPYLETAATMLTTINEKGITFNDSAMALLSDLASRDGVAAERVGRLATNVDQAIRGSSGESNAFFQQVFSRANIGGGTLGGIQAAIRSGGLFGANTDEDALISESDKAVFRRTGIGGQNMSRIAGQTLGTLDTLFGNEQSNSNLPQEQQDAKRLQRLDFVRRTFGLSSEVEAANVEELLKSAQRGDKTEEEVRKELGKIQQGNTELGNLQMINKSVEGQTQILKDIHQAILDEAGEDLGPIFNSLDRTMIKLDTTLSALMGFFGIEANQPLSNQDMTDKYLSNEKELSKLGNVKPVSPRIDPMGYEKYVKHQRLSEEQTKLKTEFKERGLAIPSQDPSFGTGQYLMRNQEQAPGLKDDFSKQIENIFNGVTQKPATSDNTGALVPLMRETLEIQKRSAKANEITARNSRVRGSAPPKTLRE